MPVSPPLSVAGTMKPSGGHPDHPDFMAALIARLEKIAELQPEPDIPAPHRPKRTGSTKKPRMVCKVCGGNLMDHTLWTHFG